MVSVDSIEGARKRLHELRDGPRCSEEVLDLWEQVLQDFSYKLGDELWLILEQVSFAALDCGRFDVMQDCYTQLNGRFPGSTRVRRLRGLLYETKGRYQEAMDLYDAIEEEDKTDSFVRKRKVAIYRGQNKISEAINELNKYLKSFMSDYEAWLELCELYLMEQDYAKAAFCMEELILTNPHNHLYHQRFAEIKYTQGGLDNMELARQYFARAISLNGNNMRALWGFFMAASNVATASKNAKTKKDNLKFSAWAADQIAAKYKAASSESDDKLSTQTLALEGMMEALHVNQAS